MKFRLHSKKKIKKVNTIKRFNIAKLNEPESKKKYLDAIKTKLYNVEDLPKDTNDKWNLLKDCMKAAALESLGSLENTPRKPWINEQIIELIETRRKFKNQKSIQDKISYRYWKNVVNRECKKAKEKWLSDVHQEIDRYLKEGKMEKAYNLINKYFGQKRMMNNVIEDENGNLLFEDKQIANRWRNYIENLYDDNDTDIELNTDETEENEENISRHEFDEALKHLKGKKACGKDEVPAELLKALDEELKEYMFNIVQEIYKKGEIPNDFKESRMVMLPKKVNSKKCSDHRTLSILSHASKVLTNIIKKRIEKKIDENIDCDQFGFRNNRGTREAILALRLIAEESIRVNKPLYIAFVDLQKAFDNVNWQILMEILKDIGISHKDIKLIYNLYKNQFSIIDINKESERASIKKGVRQGCNISPYLFNIYIEKAIAKCKEYCTGILLNGFRVQMLRFADDIAVIAPDEFNLKRTLESMNEILEEFKMKMNMTKTEILVCSRESEIVNIEVNNIKIKQSKAFKYLGSCISEDGKSTNDIKQRLAQAKRAFTNKKGLLCSNNINLNLRKQLIKTLVWSVALGIWL